MRFYCSQDGVGPMVSVDWRAVEDAIVASFADDPLDSPLAATQRLNAPRLSCESHFVRNGNGPRLDVMLGDPAWVQQAILDGAKVVVGDSLDDFGGGVAALVRPDDTLIGTLRCPECLALARCLPDEAGSATEDNHE